MKLRRLFMGLGGLVALGGTAGVVVACGKTANAVLPVEVYVPSGVADPSVVKYRTDLSVPRAGDEKWTVANAESKASGLDLTLQYNIAKLTIPLAIGSLKAVANGYSGNYAALDANNQTAWKALFAAANGQRPGSGAVMVEMSELSVDLGSIYPASVANGEQGWAVFKISRIAYDGQSTDGNSPNEAYGGKLKPSSGYHYVIDASTDPIYVCIKFLNPPAATGADPSPITSPADLLSGAFNNTSLGLVVMSRSGLGLTADPATDAEKAAFATALADKHQKTYNDIVASLPVAANYYKSLPSYDQFKDVWGQNDPVKDTTDPVNDMTDPTT